MLRIPTLSILSFVLCFSFISTAQTKEELLKDENVAWVADSYYTLDQDSSSSGCFFTRLKDLRTTHIKGDFKDLIGELFDLSLAGQFSIYQGWYPINITQVGEQPITQKDLQQLLSRTDTMLSLDPNTGIMDTTLYKMNIKRDDLCSIYLSQQWLYNMDKNQLTISNNFCAINYETPELLRGGKTKGSLCSITMEPLLRPDYSKSGPPADPSIVWAKQYEWLKFAPSPNRGFRFNYDEKYMKSSLYENEIKSMWGSNLGQVFFDLALRGKLPIYRDSLFTQSIVKDSIVRIITWPWSYTVFDRATGKEKTVSHPYTSKRENVRGIRIMQLWYFDEKEHKIMCKPYGVCVLGTIINRKGNFETMQPLFWIKLN